ncbi:MAG: ribonuclease III [Microthrixaceae bacterium]
MSGSRAAAKARRTETETAEAAALAQRLGHEFADPELLRLALLHRSAAAEADLAENNERLEFLGDSVLGLVVTDALYRRRSDQAEGRLARAKAELVDEATLAEVARDLEVGRALRLGKGADAEGGRTNDSLLADATEAVIGALYLDGGIEVARRVILERWEPYFSLRLGEADPKSRLQEVLAAADAPEPRYLTEPSGPEHRRQFSTTVEASGARFGPGLGASKKQSEQAAARLALEALERPPGRPSGAKR